MIENDEDDEGVVAPNRATIAGFDSDTFLGLGALLAIILGAAAFFQVFGGGIDGPLRSLGLMAEESSIDDLVDDVRERSGGGSRSNLGESAGAGLAVLGTTVTTSPPTTAPPVTTPPTVPPTTAPPATTAAPTTAAPTTAPATTATPSTATSTPPPSTEASAPSSPGVVASVDGATVTLTGTVADEPTSRDIAAAFEALPQVTTVDNQLSVDPATTDGVFILSGRAAQSNDRLTFTTAAEQGAVLSGLTLTNELGVGAEAPTGPGSEIVAGLNAFLSDNQIVFDSGSSSISAESDNTLDEVAARLGADESVRVVIQGHTDSQGDSGKNQTLSEERAQAVSEALVERGINAARLSSQGFGSSNPVASNATATGRAANRRIEFALRP